MRWTPFPRPVLRSRRGWKRWSRRRPVEKPRHGIPLRAAGSDLRIVPGAVRLVQPMDLRGTRLFHSPYCTRARADPERRAAAGRAHLRALHLHARSLARRAGRGGGRDSARRRVPPPAQPGPAGPVRRGVHEPDGDGAAAGVGRVRRVRVGRPALRGARAARSRAAHQAQGDSRGQVVARRRRGDVRRCRAPARVGRPGVRCVRRARRASEARK